MTGELTLAPPAFAHERTPHSVVKNQLQGCSFTRCLDGSPHMLGKPKQCSE